MGRSRFFMPLVSFANVHKSFAWVSPVHKSGGRPIGSRPKPVLRPYVRAFGKNLVIDNLMRCHLTAAHRFFVAQMPFQFFIFFLLPPKHAHHLWRLHGSHPEGRRRLPSPDALQAQPFRVRADVEVTCFRYEGIDAIRTALKVPRRPKVVGVGCGQSLG